MRTDNTLRPAFDGSLDVWAIEQQARTDRADYTAVLLRHAVDWLADLLHIPHDHHHGHAAHG